MVDSSYSILQQFYASYNGTSHLHPLTETSLTQLQHITAYTLDTYNNKTIDNLPDFVDVENLTPLDLKSVVCERGESMCLAAEFKRASPSKGDIATHLDIKTQAQLYQKAGANVISVLTEPKWFKGSLKDLSAAREATSGGVTRPAILRKDFVVTKTQILEAVAAGADTVLLMVSILPTELLKELIDYCHNLRVEPLVEVHDPSEVPLAIEAGAIVIGVNNRNLHTFQLDLNTTSNTAKLLDDLGVKYSGEGATHVLAALSGMSSAEDVHMYREVGVKMVLIGESLMRAVDPCASIKSLCLNPKDYHALNSENISSGAYIHGTKIQKVCGVTNVEDALLACRSGANLIGVIFAERSKRYVTPDQAKKIVTAVRKFGERVDRKVIDLSSTMNQQPIPTLKARSRIIEQACRTPLVVGVFQNSPLDDVRKIVEEVGIDLVQLHGTEGMKACSECTVPVIRVVDVEVSSEQNKDNSIDKICESLTTDPVAILLDTSVKGVGGGAGVTFDWDLAKNIQNRGLPVIIAGGLKPDNVYDAVYNIRPWGIDVSSGLEASPGKKDPEKVNAYLSSAKDAAKESAKGF